MQAYIISDVVMDIAAFKVSHSAGCDIDATALQAARGEVKLHRGDGTFHLWVRLAQKLTLFAGSE
eukprot:scaffold34679_cov70-Phaeocystis_antarctica.AAC.2